MLSLLYGKSMFMEYVVKIILEKRLITLRHFIKQSWVFTI